MKKIVSEKDVKEQKEFEKKLINFINVYDEINKENLIIFNADVQKDFFVERLLYINNKLFAYKEKITIDQIVNNGGVIIPYKRGVGKVTLNQRVARLEELFGGQQNQINGMQTQINRMQTQINRMQTQINGMQNQINGMQTQLTDVSTKIDKLTDLLIEHIKTHK